VRHEESQHQQALVRWADSAWVGNRRIGDFLFAVPNGGRRDKITASILKSEGVRAGVPDLVLALPVGKHPGLFIELKPPKAGRVSDSQRKWIERLREVGYRVEVCHGWDAARNVIEDYLCGNA
jgi:hypothetical protein